MLKRLMVIPALDKKCNFFYLWTDFYHFLTHYYFPDADHKFIFKSYIRRPYLIFF